MSKLFNVRFSGQVKADDVADAFAKMAAHCVAHSEAEAKREKLTGDQSAALAEIRNAATVADAQAAIDKAEKIVAELKPDPLLIDGGLLRITEAD